MTQKEALSNIQRISGYLDRCINHIKDLHQVDGRLLEEDQHAVRILKSRIRLLERLYLVEWGTSIEKDFVFKELNLRKPDDGTLVVMGEKKHSVSRFACRACDTILLDGVPFPVPNTVLCTSCHVGVMHTYTDRENLNEQLRGGEGYTPDELNALGETEVPTNKTPIRVVVVKICDNCGFNQREQVATETEVKPGRILTVLFPEVK